MNELAAKYAGKADFVYIYTVDAHPHADDLEPYSGKPTHYEYSKYKQPRTYARRVWEAEEMQKQSPHPLSDQVVYVVDDLDNPNPQNGSNPVWCVWGPAPNSGWVVKPDGIVAYDAFWFNAKDIEKVLDSLLLEQASNSPTPITV